MQQPTIASLSAADTLSCQTAVMAPESLCARPLIPFGERLKPQGFEARPQSRDSQTAQEHRASQTQGSSSFPQHLPHTPNLPSSFPSSTDCLPNYISAMQVPRWHGAAASTSEPSSLPSSPPILPFQKRPKRPTPTRASRSGSLSIIREYGDTQHSRTLSPNGLGNRYRRRSLSIATIVDAAQKRKDGSVCIRCRTMKLTVGIYGKTFREQADDVVV